MIVFFYALNQSCFLRINCCFELWVNIRILVFFLPIVVSNIIYYIIFSAEIIPHL